MKTIEKNLYYHVYNRGVSGQRIFVSAENYRFLLSKIQQYLPGYELDLIAYCLMPTHYHFLFQTSEKREVSRFIQKFFNSYSQAFNKQQNRTGTLFESRVKSKQIDSDEYMLQACRYIHLNPVESGLVNDPSKWKYSNYADCTTMTPGSNKEPPFVLRYFATPDNYKEFVLSAMETPEATP